ncbi:hsc70-interacting protein 1-like [Drosophila kikkawai]|uniref:Hsc70-interacting protein 1-like n=1 Tax=Drosophila kikkawai TaxID=30033 RepID=A0A6P4HR92_DROKI|nr:hsc70-interacting protein 1-like [Drosophila kikkawai]
MAAPMQHEDLLKLKGFIEFVDSNPTVLNLPQLQFVKDFIEKFGGKVPAGDFKMPDASAGSKCPFGGDASAKANKPASPGVDAEKNASEDSEDESESEPESDVELDMEGVIEADSEPAQPMGDSAKEPTEEEVDQAGDLRAQAASAYGEQKFDEAIALYTKAIELNPGNALFHAKRGQAFLKLKKPNACIRDCDKALELNCDSAAAYKFRGRARRLLGDFELAAKDLRQACKLDFDEEADEWLREVTPNAKKIEQHRVKQERRQAERKIKDRQRAQRRARKEQERQSANSTFPGFPGGAGGPGGGFPGGASFPGFPGGAGGGGGMPGGMPGMPGGVDMSELLGAMQDPEVGAAMQDILGNPANISKYVSNPKIFNLIKKFVPGGDIGAAFGQSEAKSGAEEASEPKTKKKDSADFVDDGLD